jgi:type VI secretion system secreted protein Hcp
MALEAFLKIEGIPGESRKAGHPDEIDVLSFSFGASNPTTVAKGTGAGASQVNISSFNIMKATDLSSTALFLRCAKGEHIPEATVTLRKAGGEKPLEYLTYKFTKVFVDSIQWSGSAAAMTRRRSRCRSPSRRSRSCTARRRQGHREEDGRLGMGYSDGTPSGVK